MWISVPRIGQSPDAEVIYPYFAIDVIHLVVVEDMLHLEQASGDDTLAVAEERRNVSSALLCQSP